MTRRTLSVVGVAGVLGWAGLLWIGVQLYGTDPPRAGFDLELLLQAGRSVAAGVSPYDPALVAGQAPVAEQLFYSYPPIVAQAMALLAPVPSALTLVVWDGLAVVGLLVIAWKLGDRLAPNVNRRDVAVATLALLPLVFPFGIGLLFGNLNVFFPLLYGLILLGALGPVGSSAPIVGGVALAIASVAKLHPASMILSFAVAGARSNVAARLAFVTVVAALALVAASFMIGGFGPWLDYLAIVRAGIAADVVDARNAGPASQISVLLGSGGASSETLARTLQPAVTAVALGVTAFAAWRVRDPVERVALAAAASLVILPVTWFHYPSALIPFALAAGLRAHGTDRAALVFTTVAAAAVVAAFAISWLPLLYLSVLLMIVAVRWSAASHPRSTTEAAAADWDHRVAG